MRNHQIDPLVSIVCFTYNHSAYLQWALDGFLMQETDFPFEIIVHDDASTDGTTEIVRKFEAHHPQLVSAIYRQRNLYSQGARGKIHSDSYRLARGKYIALCEGDDYWTDPLKLKKQVEAIEHSVGASACFHRAQRVNLTTNEVLGYYPQRMDRDRIGFGYLLEHWGTVMQTASYLFRRDAVFDLPWDALSCLSSGDLAIYLWVARKGEAVFLPDCMSIYREGGGAWSATPVSTRVRNSLNTVQRMGAWFEGMEAFSHCQFVCREKHRLACYAYQEAFASMTRNCYREAARLLVQSFHLQPSLVLRFLKNDGLAYMLAKMIVARH